MSDFSTKRRQQFITEAYYSELSPFEANALATLRETVNDPSKDEEDLSLLWQGICDYAVSHMFMQYTAGAPIEALRFQLGEVVEPTSATKKR